MQIPKVQLRLETTSPAFFGKRSGDENLSLLPGFKFGTHGTGFPEETLPKERWSMNAPYEILLYYKYSHIEDPEAYAAAHRELCRKLELKGRIIIAEEGLNGTVSGLEEHCALYRKALDEDPLTSGIAWKIDPSEGHVFPKMSIKVREEVVTLGLGEENFSPEDLTATHLKPAEWRDAMKEENIVLLDARNDYEWEVGRFEGAILPKLPSFRDFPKWIRDHREELEGKKILTYCTGGIRCEKFSGFLLKQGLKNVYQLEGGIVTYGKDPEVKGEGYEGECYVFDERLTVPVNRTEGAKLISSCGRCGVPSIRYRNCLWMPCNAQFICCEECEGIFGKYCDPICKEVSVMSQAAVVGI